ncbi:hypothetical protein [Acidisoma silvae]|uniref:Uncharacterized protein n=1 Tax=Acidisoma silvae TaxID=2802396 RepID=A0A963YXB6_9PROT|nr:hypothetical protein [Acidisoma silvae]MCB8878574.1 hypothetical protein [Acidisoma silvae]
MFRTPWDEDLAPAEAPPLPETMPPLPKKLGRRPTARDAIDPASVQEPGQGAWLYHRLTFTGSADRIAAFAAAARGSGIVPWRVDGARIEEDMFNLAVSQPKAMRSLTVEGCRILARQFRERVEARTARAAALVGTSRACAFDLHALLPVPADVLLHEPTHPKAQAWLLAHWGLSDQPRQVTSRPDARPGRRLPAGHTVLGYGFFTSGETPHVAMAKIAAAWPDLRVVLQPRLPPRPAD